MDVFIDTNVFYNKYFLVESSFGYLSNYLANTSSTLIIADLVCEEVENIRRRELAEVLSTLKSNQKRIERLSNIQFNSVDEKLIPEYSFKEVLNNAFDKIVYIDYNTISHSEVVKRALANHKPFQEKEKGYRDTLIWLSFLSHLKKSKASGEIAFITENSTDFFKDKDFHPDLKADIGSHHLACVIKPFYSLSEFIEKHIDESEHKIKHEDLYDKYLVHLDRQIEFETSIAINNYSKSDFLLLLSHSQKSYPPIHYLTDFEFEIVEGVEDAKVSKYERLKDGMYYILYEFDLRISEIKITIPKAEYLVGQSRFDSYFVNIEQTETDAKSKLLSVTLSPLDL